MKDQSVERVRQTAIKRRFPKNTAGNEVKKGNRVSAIERLVKDPDISRIA